MLMARREPRADVCEVAAERVTIVFREEQCSSRFGSGRTSVGFCCSGSHAFGDGVAEGSPYHGEVASRPLPDSAVGIKHR